MPSTYDLDEEDIDKVQDALLAIYSGAERKEAEALLDQLEDRGLRVVRF